MTYGALALVQLFFGLHYLAVKRVLVEIPPPAWALIRVACAALLLAGVALALGRRLTCSAGDLGRLALYSLFGVVFNQLCYAEGMARTSATHASILMTAIPVSTLGCAVLLRRERWSLRKLAAIGLGLAGVLLVVRPFAAPAAETRLSGDVLILVNGLSYSLFLVLSKRLMARMDALAATTLLLGFGTLGMLLPGLPALRGFDPAGVSPWVWTLGAWIVLFPTAAAYLMTYWALARVESSVVAFFVYLQPVVAAGLAVTLLGDPLPAHVLAGAALVFAGVYFALRPRRPASTADDPG